MVLRIFPCAFWSFVYHLWRIVEVLCLFLNRVTWFFYCQIQVQVSYCQMSSSLYILCINSLWDIWFVNIFVSLGLVSGVLFCSFDWIIFPCFFVCLMVFCWNLCVKKRNSYLSHSLWMSFMQGKIFTISLLESLGPLKPFLSCQVTLQVAWIKGVENQGHFCSLQHGWFQIVDRFSVTD